MDTVDASYYSNWLNIGHEFNSHTGHKEREGIARSSKKKDERKFNNIKNKISDDAFLSLQTKRR